MFHILKVSITSILDICKKDVNMRDGFRVSDAHKSWTEHMAYITSWTLENEIHFLNKYGLGPDKAAQDFILGCKFLSESCYLSPDILCGVHHGLWHAWQTTYKVFNPLKTRNPKTGTLANSEDPDEMLHNAVFHQRLHCLLRQNQSSEFFFLNYYLWFLNV